LTTSDSKGKTAASGRPSVARIVVVLAVVSAVVFGLYVGYLAFANNSFPAQEMPFGNYASVVSSNFNGTEYAFVLQWRNATYIPIYAQLTSPATDEANTPVCWLGLSTVSVGQQVFMPFTISPATATLSNVDLSIAVGKSVSSPAFTIVYNVANVSATNAPITPSNITCQEQQGD
jgi:hypothetical protein